MSTHFPGSPLTPRIGRDSSRRSRTEPARPLFFIFFLAGMPALVYQVVWQRTLSLYFGVDIYSTTITVATFMLGLGIGSLIGGQLADRVRRSGPLYALCEAALGVFGVLSLEAFRVVGESFAGSGLPTVALANFALLLVPTTLMGMTLPLMCRSLQMSDATIGHEFSVLYAVNTLGAAIGALLSAYLLIGLLGLLGATAVAAAINVSLAAAALAIIQRHPGVHADPAAAPVLPPTPRASYTRALVLACSFLSGFVALGLQLVWYRLLTLLLHGTVYVFGTILFTFLCGIALGSWIARRRTDAGDPLGRVAVSQLAISAYVLVFSLALGYGTFVPGLRHLLGATALTTFHPAPELMSGIVTVRSIYSLLDIAMWTVAFVGVPTFFMGYGFPQLMRAGTESVTRLGRSVGAVYLANILGSTAGTLIVGFVSLHVLGTEWTLRILIVVSCLTGLMAAAPRRSGPPAPTAVVRATGVTVIVVALLVFPGRYTLLRAVHYADFPHVDFVAGEGRSGVVALRTQHAIISFEQEQQILGQRRLLIDGAAHGEFQETGDDVVLDSAVRLALSAHRAPRRVLSIGLGDGRMCASAIASPDVAELVVVELNGVLGKMLKHTRQGSALFESDKLRLVVDDGRRWLLANPGEKFDVILMWPLHAAHAYSGNLYSSEFFKLVRSHLAEGGLLFARSVDMYSTARTLATVFENVVRIDGSTYIASDEELVLRPMRAGLSADETFGRLEANRETILRETTLAPLNRDFRPNSEYYFTYPYAMSLQTWGGAFRGYRETDTRWLADVLAP